jgi:hypothetical protein
MWDAGIGWEIRLTPRDERTKNMKCTKCGKPGILADDQTDPGPDELTIDSRGLVAINQHVCGACLEYAEDQKDGRSAYPVRRNERWRL